MQTDHYNNLEVEDMKWLHTGKYENFICADYFFLFYEQRYANIEWLSAMLLMYGKLKVEYNKLHKKAAVFNIGDVPIPIKESMARVYFPAIDIINCANSTDCCKEVENVLSETQNKESL